MQTQEQTWLITYGAGCKSIDHEILSAMGLEADECYSVTWRESKYSLIHLPKGNRKRRSNIIKVMQRMKDEHGIIGTDIFGYDCIACNTAHTKEFLEDHPGFRQMVTTLNTNTAALEAWMANGTLTSNRKGLLWNYIEATEPEEMTRSQLIRKIKEWSPRVRELEEIEVPKPSFSIARSALFQYQHEKSTRKMMKDVSRMEKKLNASESSDSKEGEIYAAWNPLMTNLHKLGFTGKDAETRVKALQTAGVLDPFRLVRHAHVPDARWTICSTPLFPIPDVLQQALRKGHAHLLSRRTCAQAKGILRNIRGGHQ